jgi:CheY-like chemotaxis protein
LSLLKKQSFDLILMDVSMPELDGLATCARIREAEQSSGGHLPIIAVTAHALKGDRERCITAGMDGYVSKPIRQRQLIDEIESVLGLAVTPRPPTAAEQAQAAEGAVNWQVALEYCGGEPALLRDIAEAFLEEWPKRVSEVRRALDETNFELLHRAAHTIKGSMRYFGADKAFDAAFELEQMGTDKTTPGAEEAWARLQREVQQVVPLLIDFVQGRVKL